MEHKIILKCRVCLDEFDEQKMFDLFTEVNDSTVGQAEFNDKTIRRLGEKVEFCCGVRIRQSVEMPTKICLQCFDMTRMWFNFRQMCLNSQVYLESLCTDRVRPPGIGDDSDGDYLEYLLDELQTFRSDKNRFNHDELNKVDESESTHSESGELYEAEMDENVDIDTSNEYIEAVPYEAISCDPEFEHVIENIKKEQEDESSDEATSREHRKIKAQKNLRKCDTSPKIRHRPPSVTSYMCSICGNVYNKKASFTYHMSLHSDVKPHECELCGKGFRQVCELKNHMRRHTGEKPYKCTYCERHFTDRSEKHRHERVHTNTRPYECKICGKTFMYSAILKNHSKLHSGEKDYNCLVCQKAFTLQHQLKAHLQTISHKQKEAQFVNAGYEVVYE